MQVSRFTLSRRSQDLVRINAVVFYFRAIYKDQHMPEYVDYILKIQILEWDGWQNSRNRFQWYFGAQGTKNNRYLWTL
jgi:hypothetical protein